MGGAAGEELAAVYSLHATTVDMHDQMMWCNPTMTTNEDGTRDSVWQYGAGLLAARTANLHEPRRVNPPGSADRALDLRPAPGLL